MKKRRKSCNYARDRIMSFLHPFFATLIEVLEREGGNLFGCLFEHDKGKI